MSEFDACRNGTFPEGSEWAMTLGMFIPSFVVDFLSTLKSKLMGSEIH